MSYIATIAVPAGDIRAQLKAWPASGAFPETSLGRAPGHFLRQ